MCRKTEIASIISLNTEQFILYSEPNRTVHQLLRSVTELLLCLVNYCGFNIRLCACTWCAGLRLTLSLFHLMSRSLLEFSVLSVGGTVSLLPSLSRSCQFITTQFLDFLTLFPAPLALSSLLQFSLPVLCFSRSATVCRARLHGGSSWPGAFLFHDTDAPVTDGRLYECDLVT